MTLRDTEKIITNHLKKRFNEGKQKQGQKDFFFTSAKLKKNLPVKIDTRVIGRVLKDYIAPKGIIELWSTNRKNRTVVWKTCFNGGN